MESSDDATATVGLRERKKIETRRTIKQVALELALESGPESLTVETVAGAAEVSPRTFFNYFSCKEDALVTETAAAAAKLRPLIMERPLDESPLHTLRTVVTETDPLSLMSANRDQALARQRLVQESPTLMSRQLAQHSELERELAEAFAERLGVDREEDLRPALLASTAVGAMRVALRRWTAVGSEPLRDLFDNVFDLLERGVLAESPRPTGGN